MRASSGYLKQYWYVAATRAELGAGVLLRRTILGEHLVLWRAETGAVVAQSDRCLHRNAPLSAGGVRDDCVVCPYHGWAYGPSGALVGVPSLSEGAVLPALTLQTWQVREQYGLIWVWMGEGAPDKPPFEMPRWETPGWKAYYMVTEFENGVTQLAENFMDVPHTVFVHRGWFRSEAKQTVKMHVKRTADSVLVTYDQPNDAIGFTSRVLNPGGEPMVHTDKFYLPNVTRVDYDFGGRTGFVITSTCTPESEGKTRVYTLISYCLGSRVLNRLARPFLPFYTRRVIEQDVEIMKVQGDNLRAHQDERFHHTRADLHHTWIEELRAWAQAGGGEPLPELEASVSFVI